MIRYHIRSHIENGSSDIVHTPGIVNTADIFTKSLGRAKFQEHVSRPGLEQISINLQDISIGSRSSNDGIWTLFVSSIVAHLAVSSLSFFDRQLEVEALLFHLYSLTSPSVPQPFFFMLWSPFLSLCHGLTHNS